MSAVLSFGQQNKYLICYACYSLQINQYRTLFGSAPHYSARYKRVWWAVPEDYPWAPLHRYYLIASGQYFHRKFSVIKGDIDGRQWCIIQVSMTMQNRETKQRLMRLEKICIKLDKDVFVQHPRCKAIFTLGRYLNFRPIFHVIAM